MNKTLKINENDNVIVALQDLKKGEIINNIELIDDIPCGHKLAIKDIKINENIIKYGCPIGHATLNIIKGSHVHNHNVATNLSGKLEYTYNPVDTSIKTIKEIKKVKVFPRAFNKYGIRNYLYIVPLVGCVNNQANLIKKKVLENIDYSKIDGVIVCSHPFGCSQLGDDNANTIKTLQAIVKHPNAGGVLVLSLGCENNQLEPFKESLGNYDKERVYFLKAQDVKDEVNEGYKLCLDLYNKMINDKRVEMPLSVINIGLKCGGSDGFSGISANPLVGMMSDYLIASNGTTILSEVPEMFGAEQILMNKAKDEETFNKIVKLINDFKQYYQDHNQVCYENPSPGNKKGGITTLEDKSLGCTQKAGNSAVNDCLYVGDEIKEKGLNLLNGPGNDMVACTNLMAIGAHIILFTTGRGTPFGSIIPTIKIATNTRLATLKDNWIDFNAGKIIDGMNKDEVFNEFLEYLISVINNETKTKNEINEFYEISIFKDGVTL